VILFFCSFFAWLSCARSGTRLVFYENWVVREKMVVFSKSSTVTPFFIVKIQPGQCSWSKIKKLEKSMMTFCKVKRNPTKKNSYKKGHSRVEDPTSSYPCHCLLIWVSSKFEAFWKFFVWHRWLYVFHKHMYKVNLYMKFQSAVEILSILTLRNYCLKMPLNTIFVSTIPLNWVWWPPIFYCNWSRYNA